MQLINLRSENDADSPRSPLEVNEKTLVAHSHASVAQGTNNHNKTTTANRVVSQRFSRSHSLIGATRLLVVVNRRPPVHDITEGSPGREAEVDPAPRLE